MKVELFEYTGKGTANERWHAAHILLLTKNTRLSLDHGGMAEVVAMSDEEKIAALTAMADTIPSSWEFVDVTFRLSGVSRAFAQQLTRTRQASYAMQSLRVVDGAGVKFVNPCDRDDFLWPIFEELAKVSWQNYEKAIEFGAAREDARALLPLNTETATFVKYNLRAFTELVKSRESLRTQSEYYEVVKAMKQAVLDVWPWSAPFFRPREQAALEILEKVVEELGLEVGHGLGWRIAKAMDLLRKA